MKKTNRRMTQLARDLIARLKKRRKEEKPSMKIWTHLMKRMTKMSILAHTLTKILLSMRMNLKMAKEKRLLAKSTSRKKVQKSKANQRESLTQEKDFKARMIHTMSTSSLECLSTQEEQRAATITLISKRGLAIGDGSSLMTKMSQSLMSQD